MQIPAGLSFRERAVLAAAAAQIDAIIGPQRIDRFLHDVQCNWPVAQSVERRAVNADVAGSSPARLANSQTAAQYCVSQFAARLSNPGADVGRVSAAAPGITFKRRT